MAVENSGIDVIGEVEEVDLLSHISWQVTIIALPFLIGAAVLIVVSTIQMDGIVDIIKTALGVIGLLWAMFVVVEELQ